MSEHALLQLFGLADRHSGECKKAGKILAAFVDPRQAFGPDKIIPPEILAKAKVTPSITRLRLDERHADMLA